MTKKINSNIELFDIFLYICVFLSGLVPRYILNFKIHVVIGISMFSVAVLVTWLICSRRVMVFPKIECYYFYIWFVLIIGAVWRAERIGIWASYVDWIITAILFMQILYHRPDEKSFNIAIRAIVDALFIQLIIGVYEINTHHYLFEIGTTSKRLYGNVAISMFHNLNDYVTFTVTLLPFAIYLLINRKGVFTKAYYSLIIVIDIFLSLRSESRGAILGLILIAGTVIFLFFRRSKTNRYIVASVISIVTLAIILSVRLREIISTFFVTVVLDQSGISNSIRTNLIKNGLHFLKTTYGFGVGAGNLYQWLAEKAIYPTCGVLFIHNWYLEIAVTFGVVLFILYITLHVKILVSLFKQFSMESGFWSMNNTLLVSFVAFSLVSISSSSNVYSEWVWMYLVLISTYVMFKTTKNIQNADY